MKRPVISEKTGSHFIALSSLIFIIRMCFLPTGDPAYGALGASSALEEVVPDRVIYVNNQHPKADDSNRGIKDELPIKTIGAAADIAVLNYEKGFSTKVVIYPGTYREQVKMDFRKRKESPVIMFEAKEPGAVVLSGSDVWNDWERVGETNVYAHRWPHKWGYMPGPPQLTQKYGPIVRRREMIFLDHKPMDQVLSLDELKKGSFYISEEESKVYLHVTSQKPLAETIVEVAIRSDLFKINQASNIILRGLTFQHDTTGMSTLGAAVHFVNSNNLLIEDCEFVWNNWFGLRFSSVANVITRRNKAMYNGGAGWEAWKVKNLLSEEDETSYNNWRGVKGNFLGWEIAGSKHHNIHDAIYRRYKSVGNHTRGFWLDYDNSNIQIEDGCFYENLMDGIHLEASQGPITIRNSRILRNQNYGISSDSSEITLEGNLIFNNRKSQIKHSFGNDRAVKNWETGEQLKIHGDGWILRKNVIATDSTDALLELSGGEQFLDSLSLNGNTWYKRTPGDLFRVGKRSMTFPEWKEFTGHGQQETYINNTREFGTNLSAENCNR